MAVEYLILTCRGGRRSGTIINRQQCSECESARWGSNERPPIFQVIRIPHVGLDTMDRELERFGAGRSKLVVNFSRLPRSAKRQLIRRQRLEVTRREFITALDDSGQWGSR